VGVLEACQTAVEPRGQEPVAPMVRRNPPKLLSLFAKASDFAEPTMDTRIPPRSGNRGFLRRRVIDRKQRPQLKGGIQRGQNSGRKENVRKWGRGRIQCQYYFDPPLENGKIPKIAQSLVGRVEQMIEIERSFNEMGIPN